MRHALKYRGVRFRAIPVAWPYVLLLPYHMRDEARADLMQGTLDLMVLKTLQAMGPLHGYGLARRIE